MSKAQARSVRHQGGFGQIDETGVSARSTALRRGSGYSARSPHSSRACYCVEHGPQAAPPKCASACAGMLGSRVATTWAASDPAPIGQRPAESSARDTAHRSHGARRRSPPSIGKGHAPARFRCDSGRQRHIVFAAHLSNPSFVCHPSPCAPSRFVSWFRLLIAQHFLPFGKDDQSRLRGEFMGQSRKRPTRVRGRRQC